MSDAVSFLLSVYLNISHFQILILKSLIFLKTISFAKTQIMSYIVFNRYKNPSVYFDSSA